jgi:hypothetical protein
MRQAQPNTSHQSRPNRRFLRRLPAAAAAAALIAATPAYAAVQPSLSRPAVAAHAAKQSAVMRSDVSSGGAPQTIGSNR